MAFGIGDSLRVKVSAATSDFTRGMEDAQDSLNSVRNASTTTSGSLQVLQNRVNELGDELSRTERKSSSLSRSLGVLTGAVSALNVSVLGFNTVQLAGMITGFGTLLTTVVPLTSALFGLATAAVAVSGGFAAVIGTGIFAFGEKLAKQNRKQLQQLKAEREQLEKVKEETGELTQAQQDRLATLNKEIEALDEKTSALGALSTAFGPVKEQLKESALAIGEDFIPLIRDTIEALPAFIRQIEDALGNLQPFADALRDAGQVAFEVLPEMIGWFAQLGRESLPMLREFGSWLADNWKPILEGSVETLRDLTPELLGFIDAMIELIPAMNEFGTAVLEKVLPAINGFSEALGEAMQVVNENKQLIEAVLIGSFIAITGPLGAVITLLVKFRDTVADSIGTLNSKYIQPFIQGFNSAFDNQLQEVLDETIETVDLAIQTFKDLFGLEVDAESWGKSVGQAVNGVQEALVGLNDVLQGDIGIKEFLGGGSWEELFDGLVSDIDGFLGTIEETLVGTSGSGGLTAAFEKAGDNANQWLQTEGPKVIRQGIDAMVDAAVDAFQSLSVILVGPDGQSGVLTEMVDQADAFLSDTAPKLFGAAMQAIGRVIRQAFIDIFVNPLVGKDSIFWDALADATKFLIHNIPQMLVAVGEAIVNGIIAGVTGLVDGLVGNSVIKDALEDAATFAENHMGEWIGGIGGAITDAIVNNITGLAEDIQKKIEQGVKDATKAVKQGQEGALGYGDETNTGDRSSTSNDRCGPGMEWDPNLQACVPTGSTRTSGDGVTITNPWFRNATTAQTGGFIDQAGLAMLHSGERVVPASQVTDRGEVSLDPETIAEGVARGFSRVDNDGENVTVEVELRDNSRYTASQR